MQGNIIHACKESITYWMYSLEFVQLNTKINEKGIVVIKNKRKWN
jgi:hypothetical protein